MITTRLAVIPQRCITHTKLQSSTITAAASLPSTRAFSTLLSSPLTRRTSLSHTQCLTNTHHASTSFLNASATPSVASLPLSSGVLSAFATVQAVRHTRSATSARTKKQKEWRLRYSKGFTSLKSHSGCKKRFRFISRFAAVCKHHGAYHKNYHKRKNRLRRLRAMKIVPRNLVKRLKVMLPYWRRQLKKEDRYQKLTAETSVKSTSQISYERQKEFIEAQNARLQSGLLEPKAYFPVADFTKLPNHSKKLMKWRLLQLRGEEKKAIRKAEYEEKQKLQAASA